MESQLDVFIVGAGPSGLMAACLLAQQGITFRIIDVNATPVTQSRALAIQSRTLEILSLMGLADRFLECGRVVHKIEPRPYGKALHLNFDCLKEETRFPYVLILEQSQTETLLEQALEAKGCRVERQSELIGLVQNHQNVALKIRNLKTQQEESVFANYVLAADGAHSLVRKTLGLPFVGEPYAQHFWLADLKLEGALPEDALSFYVKNQGFLAFLPLPEPKTYRLVGQLNQSDRDVPSLQAIEAQIQSMTDQRIRCSVPRWLTTFNLHHRLVTAMQVDRVFLLGDAAHIHSPVGGQGMNTGMQDAFNLSWKLALVLKGVLPVSALNSYQAERHPVGEYLLKKSDKMFQLVTSEKPIKKWMRRLFFLVMWRILTVYPSAADGLIQFISQLKIRYKKGWVFDVSLFHRPTAGERAPWCEFPILGGGKCDLYTLMNPLYHHLFVFSKRLTQAQYDLIRSFHHEQIQVSVITKDAYPGLIQAQSNQPFHSYNVKEDALIFVRPDGYIAIRYESLAFDAFQDFLSHYFLPSSDPLRV